MLKHNVWYHIYYCLVNRNCEPQLLAAPQCHRHGVIFTPMPTPSWTSTTPSFCELLPAVRIFPLQRSRKLSVASSVTPPCIEKVIHGQDPVELCACVFIKLNCWVASVRQSPGGVVVKALLLALHDKDNSFLSKAEQFIQSCYCTDSNIMRMRDFLARKRKSRELQLSRHLQDRRLPVFSNNDTPRQRWG